ncbi:hypothetical protein ACFPPF_22030 [Xenophilus aerolatus]|nr:hypothetical protein [Xenophilus aerolatus]
MKIPCSDRPPNAGRFAVGGRSGNLKGRPSNLELARRRMQPLLKLGVRDDEIEALAAAALGGDPLCWAAALALVASRLRVDSAALEAAAAPASPKEGA